MQPDKRVLLPNEPAVLQPDQQAQLTRMLLVPVQSGIGGTTDVSAPAA